MGLHSRGAACRHLAEICQLDCVVAGRHPSLCIQPDPEAVEILHPAAMDDARCNINTLPSRRSLPSKIYRPTPLLVPTPPPAHTWMVKLWDTSLRGFRPFLYKID